MENPTEKKNLVTEDQRDRGDQGNGTYRESKYNQGVNNNERKTSIFCCSSEKDKCVRVPTRAIALASLLFCAGCLSLIIAFLVMTGQLKRKLGDSVLPLLMMGILMIIPGFYHIRIAYFVFKRVPGYSFDNIPEFGD